MSSEITYPTNADEMAATINRLVDCCNAHKRHELILTEEVNKMKIAKDEAIKNAESALKNAEVAQKLNVKSMAQVPLFSGEDKEDVDNFIFLLENSFKIGNTHKDLKVPITVSYFRGMALE